MFSRKPLLQERKIALGINSSAKEWVHDPEKNLAIFRFKSWRVEIPGGIYETYLIYVGDDCIAVDVVERQKPCATKLGQPHVSDISFEVQKILAANALQPKVGELPQLILNAFEAYGSNGYPKHTGEVTMSGNSIEKIRFI